MPANRVCRWFIVPAVTAVIVAVGWFGYRKVATSYRLRQGKAAIECGQYELALEELSRAIESDPSFGIAYFYRACVCYEQADFDQAIADSSAASSRGPSESPR